MTAGEVATVAASRGDGTNAYCVVIPALNAENFIEEALASVARQTVPAAEVIVVDDGSSDRTAIRAAAAGAQVVRLTASHGPSVARNRGVRASSAPLVAFLDADDQWLPDHAERLLSALESPGVVFAGSLAERYGSEHGVVPTPLPDGVALDLCDRLIVDNPIIQSSVMLKRATFELAGGYDESLRLSEDFELWSRVAPLGLYMLVGRPTVRRRMHPDQVSQRTTEALVRAGWQVRRRVVRARLAAASPADRASVIGLIRDAAKLDLAFAVWTGRRWILSLVREEIRITQLDCGLDGELGSLVEQRADDIRCLARRVLKTALGSVS